MIENSGDWWSGDWWKYLLGFITVVGGGVIRDAIKRGEIQSDINHLTVRVDDIETVIEKNPCATEIRCLERRQEVRRELDAGIVQFSRLEESIKHNEITSQSRHNDIMKILLSMKK